MNKKELISKTADILRERGIRKPVKVPRQVFHITDDEGNQKDFIVRKTDKTVMYNIEDITAVLDACLSVIEQTLEHGEEVGIHGFGNFSMRNRSARATFHPVTGQPVEIEAHHVLKFSPGKNLKLAAKLYEAHLREEPVEPDSCYPDNFFKDGDK